MTDIIQLRLHNHHLKGTKFKNPAEIVSHYGAVQSQDFPAAKWALSLRIQNATDTSIQKAYDAGHILRTHVLRPTWHFVSPEDIRWLQDLTGERVHKVNGHMTRKLELDDKLLARSGEILAKALQGKNYLTRSELAEVLEKNKIPARGQRLAYIVMHAELSALICSGPKRGKQFTYALLEERAPEAKTYDREEGLAKLALKYFSGHGPAQIKDFSWWSGLALKEAQSTVELIKSKLEQVKNGDKTYWFVPGTRMTTLRSPEALLLSIFDEYTIAYRDRSDMSEERYIEKMLMMGNALTSVMLIDGLIVGSWKRKLTKKHVEISFNPFRKLFKVEVEALEKAAADYGRFIELPISL